MKFLSVRYPFGQTHIGDCLSGLTYISTLPHCTKGCSLFPGWSSGTATSEVQIYKYVNTYSTPSCFFFSGIFLPQ